MKLKMQEIINFSSFFTKVRSQKLPFKTSYHLTLLAQEIEKHFSFYQEELQNILQEHGKKDEKGELILTDDGQGVKLNEETMNEAYAKLSELRMLDIELPEFKFCVDDFDKVELAPEEMVAIMPFIQE